MIALLSTTQWLPQMVFVYFAILSTILFTCKKKAPASDKAAGKDGNSNMADVAKDKSKKEGNKSKKEGSKKEGSKKEGSKKVGSKKEKEKEKEKASSKKEKEKQSSKKEKSKKDTSKKEKPSSKKEKEKEKEKESSKKEEPKKEEPKKDDEKKDEKKEDGGGDKGAKSQVGQDKSKVKDDKGSKLLDADEHVSDVKDSDADNKKEGEAKEGDAKKESEKKEEPKKEEPKKEEPKKEEPKKEEPKKEEPKKEEPKKEELKKEEELKLIVEPKELKFTNPGGKPEILKLNFSNTTGTRIGIKIKCSDNNLFRVNPVFSTLEKDGKCVVEVSRNAGNSKADKLSAVYVEAPPDIKDVPTIFKVAQTVAASKIKTINVNLFHEAAKP